MKGSKPPLPAPRQSQEKTEISERPPLPARPRREKPATTQITETPQINQIESLREFALRKNFTESEFEEAISRTTSLADTNDLFSQLISVRAEKGVDAHTAQRTQPRSRNVPDPSSLRKIVIDGSNVAMT